MRSLRLVLAFFLLVGFWFPSGCTPTPPVHWARGGATLVIAPAHWVRPGQVVEIRKDGTVLQDGQFAMALDKVGRVYDEDNAPVALLDRDGVLRGNDGVVLGWLGENTAALPGRRYAWLGIAPDGSVVHYSEDGIRTADGHWVGCQRAEAVRTCLLVSHIISLREWRARPRTSVGVGFGFGVVVPVH